MATLVLNGTTYSGLPNGTGNQSAWQPTSYDLVAERIGVTLVAANGTRNRVERSVTKRQWEIGWDATNSATKSTIETLAAVATTWTMTAYDGSTYTVQTEEPPDISWAFNTSSGASFWDITLKVYQQ